MGSETRPSAVFAMFLGLNYGAGAKIQYLGCPVDRAPGTTFQQVSTIVGYLEKWTIGPERNRLRDTRKGKEQYFGIII